MWRLLFTALGLIWLAGCATGGARAFKAAEKAYAAGDLTAADAAYTRALEAEPNNLAYQLAQKKVRAELAQPHIAEARTKEKAKDFEGASQAWGKAAELVPDESTYAVRRDLSGLVAKDPSPDEKYTALVEIQRRHPNNEIVGRSLAKAKESAYRDQLQSGQAALKADDGKKALKHFERARAIDPSTPDLPSDLFSRAEALSLVADARAKVDTDPVGAYELYQAAYAKRPLPPIKREMNKVRRKASALISALDRARSLAKRGRYAQALTAYQNLLAISGAPASAKEEAEQTRLKLVEMTAQQATEEVAKNRLRRAQRTLGTGLAYAGLDADNVKTLNSGFDLARNGDPKALLQAIDSSGLGTETALGAASRAFAVAAANEVVKKARRISKRDKAAALTMLSSLDDFKSDLPAIDALRTELVAGAFLALLKTAKSEAQRGNDIKAASSLVAALNASQAPDKMRGPTQAGAQALKEGRYVEAGRQFGLALSAAPRSRLAQAGLDCARIRRTAAEAEAVRILSGSKGDGDKAAETLETALAMDSGHAPAKQAAEALLSKLSKTRAGAKAAPQWTTWGAKVTVMPEAAKQALLTGAAAWTAGNLDAAETAFSSAVSAAPNVKLAKVALGLVQSQALGALKSDVAKVLQGSEKSAESLGELLSVRPDDPEGQRVLKALLSRAEALAASQRDADAANLLRLAVIATRPAPNVKPSLDSGVEALKKGQAVESERAFAEALAVNADQPVAQVGRRIVRSERLEVLQAGLKMALSGRGFSKLQEGLRMSVQVDPADERVNEVVSALLEAASQSAKKGQLVRVANLLETANIATTPEAAKADLTAANTDLKKERFTAAQERYEKVLKTTESRLATLGRSIAKEQAMGTLVQRVDGLAKGTDLEDGAKAAAQLFEVDPANRRVLDAVQATLARAERAATAKNDKRAARELFAAAVAMGEAAALRDPINLLSEGRHQDSENGFSAHATVVAKRGADIARGRRLGNLTSDLTAGGMAAAKAIRKLWDTNPENPDAQRAFDKILDRAMTASKAGQNLDAAQALDEAAVARGGSTVLLNALKSATEHLREGRYPQSQLDFQRALKVAATSKVAQQGQRVAETFRATREQAALNDLGKADDPRPAAEVLYAGLAVDPGSERATKGLDVLISRIEGSVGEGQDAQTAQIFEAAIALAAVSDEAKAGLREAVGQYAKGDYAGAEQGFVKLSDLRLGRVGAEAGKRRQVLALEKEYEAAEKGLDVLWQQEIVLKILKLDPENKVAKRRAQDLESKVKDTRVATARAQISQGNHGMAYVYLSRALQSAPDDGAAQSAMKEVKEALTKRTDLVIMVERVVRDRALSRMACDGFDEMFREQLMTVSSRRTDLGGYVLSPKWTQAYLKGDDRAPEVSGGLDLTMTNCKIGPATGKATFEWRLMVPRKGDPAVKGKISTQLPSGKIPRDEQDGAGNNARKIFSEEAAKQVTEAISQQRDETDQWLLVLGEHGIKKKDTPMVADAFARLKVKGSVLVDVDRLLKIEEYLKANIR